MSVTPKTMTASELIKALSDLPPDLPLFIWIDGERYPVIEIDDSWVAEGGWIDINSIRMED